MFCTNCGKESAEGTKFCGGCGAEVNGVGDNSSGGEGGTGGRSEAKVSFGKAINLGFSNYFKFNGRATRAEYWWWVLFTVAIHGILFIVNSARSGGSIATIVTFSGYFLFLTLIPSLALGSRRLHDINRTGWWQLLWISTVVGSLSQQDWTVVFFILIIPSLILPWWATRKSDPAPNRYD